MAGGSGSTPLGGAPSSAPTNSSSKADAAGGSQPLVLGHAINMASAAMQAYLEPSTGAAFQRRSAQGTLTQFLSAEFVQEHFSAVLNVTVHTATGFEGADWFSKPDLFIEVSAGSSYATTTTKKNASDSVWDETLLLWPEAITADTVATTLTVRVFDADATGRHDLGFGVVELGEDWSGLHRYPAHVEIHKSGGRDGKPELTVGTVSLTLSAVKLTQAAQRAGMKQSAARLDAGVAKPTEPTQQLPNEANAADVFAAVHKPTLQVAPGASNTVRSSITASVALDPDLSLAGMKTLSKKRPGGWVPKLGDKIDEGEASVSVPIEGQAVEEPETVMAGVEQALEDGTVLEAPTMQTLSDAWGTMRHVFPEAFLLDGSPVAFIHAESDTQVWIHCNRKLKQVVIAFRGTECLRDWRTDCAALFKTIVADPTTGALRTLGDVGRSARRGLNLGPLNVFFRPMIHAGFYNAYRTVDVQIREVVYLCTEGDPEWSVTTTGHSLGGALATVCAYDLAISKDFPRSVSSYTYGSPRAGNGRFAREYGQVVPNTFRMLNALDIVPQLPPLPLYAHVGHECRLFSSDVKLALPERNDLIVFREDDVTVSAHKQVVRRLGFFDHSNVLWGRMWRFGWSLFSGKAVRHHLGDKYINSLCDVMMRASQDAPEAAQSAVSDLRDSLVAFQAACAAA